MGKKRKNPKPDADGILRTGIYERWTETVSPAQFFEGIREQQSRTIRGWLNGHLECLVDIIKPHIDDTGRTVYALDLGDGWRGYRLANELPEQVRDAIDCMNEVRILQCHIDTNDALVGDLGWAINSAFKLGRISEKMKVRPFEPLVRGKRKSELNLKKPSREELRAEAEQAIKAAKEAYPGRADDKNFIKGVAAKSLGLTIRSLNRRLA